jgi:hypothetical protein
MRTHWEIRPDWRIAEGYPSKKHTLVVLFEPKGMPDVLYWCVCNSRNLMEALDCGFEIAPGRGAQASIRHGMVMAGEAWLELLPGAERIKLLNRPGRQALPGQKQLPGWKADSLNYEGCAHARWRRMIGKELLILIEDAPGQFKWMIRAAHLRPEECIGIEPTLDLARERVAEAFLGLAGSGHERLRRTRLHGESSL